MSWQPWHTVASFMGVYLLADAWLGRFHKGWRLVTRIWRWLVTLFRLPSTLADHEKRLGEMERLEPTRVPVDDTYIAMFSVNWRYSLGTKTYHRQIYCTSHNPPHACKTVKYSNSSFAPTGVGYMCPELPQRDDKALFLQDEQGRHLTFDEAYKILAM